ncbi:MAG TPA: hypothetical protein HPP87_03360 [Planctomycetes bacterium]|nr:hypothetical protein [Planctomycetota bacterium]
MNGASQSHNTEKVQSSTRELLTAYIILVIAFIAAAAVRLYNINAAKLYFSPTRQYYSFCIAKGFYCQSAEDVSPQNRRIAAVNKEALDDKEPPVTEYLVARIWSIFKGPNHWAPSLLCSLFWLVGGTFVFLIVKKYTTAVPAAVATAFYLLCPFGVLISRSFQPEALMVMMFLGAVYTIFNYYEKQSLRRLFVTGLVSGLAVLVKVSIIFSVWAAFIAPGICKNGFRRTIFSRRHLAFVILGIGPAFSYYSYLAVFTDEVRMVAESVFAPRLLWDWFFWTGWFNQLGSVVGFIPLTAAVFGIFFVRDKTVKSILTALAVGYLAYALIFTYTTATHDYYQVQLIPVVVLAVSPVLAFFLDHIRLKGSRCHRLTLAAGLLLVVAFVGLLGGVKTGAFRSESKFVRASLAFAYKFFGIRPDYLSQYGSDYPEFIERAEKIGYAVNHSEKTITLGLTVPLWYYGDYAGYRWPRHHHWSARDSHAGIGTGAKWKEYRGLGASELYEKHFSRFYPRYFVVAEPREFEKQKSLREFLFGKFKLLVQEEKYLIFDLGEPKQ